MAENPEIYRKNKSVSYGKYRRQSLLQIHLPLVLAVLTALLLIILAGLAETEVVSVWSEVSIIFLIVPTLVIGLIVLLILSFGVYGLGRVIRIFPQYFSQIQESFSHLELHIRNASDGAVKPFVRIRSASAGLRAGMTRFSGRGKQ